MLYELPAGAFSFEPRWLFVGCALRFPACKRRDEFGVVCPSMAVRRQPPEQYGGALAQTRDGFLWLGTPSGLVRFDGIRLRRFFTNQFHCPAPIAAQSPCWLGAKGRCGWRWIAARSSA